MKNKKGFTLIELLAVIVILAIIAVIATPIILGVIDNAKKSAARDSAYGALDAVKAYYATSIISDPTITLPITITFPTDVAKLKMSGTKPTSGSVTILKDGTIAFPTTLVVDTYNCTYNEVFTCTK